MALKKVRCDISDPECVKMMAMEIVVLRHLEHPSVIKLDGIVLSRMSESLYLIFGELGAACWPSWLAVVAGEALNGWIKLLTDQPLFGPPEVPVQPMPSCLPWLC